MSAISPRGCARGWGEMYVGLNPALHQKFYKLAKVEGRPKGSPLIFFSTVRFFFKNFPFAEGYLFLKKNVFGLEKANLKGLMSFWELWDFFGKSFQIVF